MALCAAISECCCSEVAAEVLHEMAVHLDAKTSSYMPSTTQWLGVVRASEGALAASMFPKKADALMSLIPPPEDVYGRHGPV